jgi:hypothetical protein
MWEIFSLGETDPYPNETNRGFIERVRAHGFNDPIDLELPENGSDKM